MKIFFILLVLGVHCATFCQNENESNTNSENPVNFVKVSEMAIYPGCEKFEGNKNKLIKCFGDKLQHDLIKFLDTDYPDEASLKKQVLVSLEFHIDSLGRIINISSKGGDVEFMTQAENALQLLSNNFIKKKKFIQPAKLSNGEKAQVIFGTRLGLANPDYAENWIYYLYLHGESPKTILKEIQAKGVKNYNLRKVEKLIDKFKKRKN